MKINRYLKYLVRFLFLQIVLTYISIYYFNNFLISNEICDPCVGKSFRMQINNNLWEDRNRFFNFVNEDLINIETFIGLFIFVFLIILYSTKFYRYINEIPTLLLILIIFIVIFKPI